MGVKQWLNESPGAKLIEAEEAAKKAKASTASPSIFDPRTEVSADAKAIIRRWWLLLFWFPLLIFVGITTVVGVAVYLFSAGVGEPSQYELQQKE